MTTSSVSLHRAWITDLRRLARHWGADYEPSDWLTPIQEVREAYLGAVLATEESLLWMVFSKTANPQTMAACLWHYVGRDILGVMRAKGYVNTPNILSDPNNTFTGAKDLLVKLPNRQSPKEQIAMTVELLAAKRDRRQRLADNALSGIEELDHSIDEYNALLLSKV